MICAKPNTVKRVVVLDGEAAFLAAAYLRMSVGEKAQITYVGINGAMVDDRVLRVLKEDGMDVGGWQNAIVDLHMGEAFDVVITMSEEARARVPLIRAAHRIHCPFPYVPVLGDDKQDMAQVYRLRNEVKYFSEQLVNDLLMALAS